MDRVYEMFLENTAANVEELRQKSDVVEVTAIPPFPASTYVCTFRVPHLCRLPVGTVAPQPGPVVCVIRFPEDYVRSVDPHLFMNVARIQTPGFLHPNVTGGRVCLGKAFKPGTPLVAVVWQLFEMVTYRNCTVDERNALNPEACRLVREHPSLVAQLGRPRLFRPRAPKEVASP